MINLKISIITINYNNKLGLENTIKSVLRQTYDNIEYIVIDGNSTDGSKEVIEKYKHRISYWVSEPDNGIYNAMNKGAMKATGEYLLFLNSGDLLIDDNILNIIYPEFKSEEDIIFGLLKCYPSGAIGYTDIQTPLTLLDFFEKSPIPHPASFIKRNIFEKVQYDESLKIVSDWKFFLQAIVLYEYSYKKIDKVITLFEENGISNKYKNCCEEERLQVLKELLPKAIYSDYFHFSSGFEYKGGNYETFYSRLSQYRYHKIIYMISVLLVRLISVFKPSARFARKFPLN